MSKEKKIVGMIFALSVLINVLIHFEPKTAMVDAASSSQSDIQLMARAINGEARGEPYEGQVAIGAVILNRVKHASFPDRKSVV